MKSSCLRFSLLHLAVHLLREQALLSSAFVIETRSLSCRNRCIHRDGTVTGSNQNKGVRFRTRAFRSKPEEYDDGIGDIPNRRNNSNSNNNDNNSDGSDGDNGESLAAEFYKNLQQRQDAEKRKEASASSDVDVDVDVYSMGSPTDRTTIGSLFDDDDERDRDTPPTNTNTPAIKFTGRRTNGDSSSSSSSNYFGRSSSSTGRNAPNRDRNPVRERMMRREYDLVSGATGRTALGLQAGIALSMLLFFVYIGLSGGIVSGDAALTADFGGDDFIQFEEIIPLPRDSDTSVWL
eukprot:jgi/Psemu1/300882/fgenesh1_kg.21_\